MYKLYAMEKSNKTKNFACTYCIKRFASQFRLNRHVRCHTNERPFPCEKCGRAFRESGHVKKHLEVCPANNAAREAKPPVRTKRSSKRKRRSEKRTGDVWACSCGMAFLKRSTLREHRRTTHAGLKVCKCGIVVKENEKRSHKLRCPAMLSSETPPRLRPVKKPNADVVVVSTSFTCSLCSRSFISADQLQSHIRRRHPEAAAAVSSPPRPTTFTSNFADHSYASNGSPQKASPKLATRTSAVTKKARAPPKSTLKRCTECKKYVGRTSFNHHQMFHKLTRINKKYLAGFISSAGKVYLCRYITCSVAFRSLEELTKHEVVHTGAKPYVCGACDEQSITRRQHNTHVVQCSSGHLMKNPCGQCGKFFQRLKLLWQHYKSHRPNVTEGYTCGHCGEYFNSRLELNGHHTDTHQIIQPIHRGLKSKNDSSPKKQEPGSGLLDQTRAYLQTMSKVAQSSSATKPAASSGGMIEPGEQLGDLGENITFNCMYCDKSFHKESRMIKHERVHTMKKPHVCHICGKAFTSKHKVKRHLRKKCGVGSLEGDDLKVSTLWGLPEKNAYVDDEVISIASSPSPSPSPTPSPSLAPPPPSGPDLAQSLVQIQKLDPVTVVNQSASSLPGQVVNTFSTTNNIVYNAVENMPTVCDQVYLIQYDRSHSGPLNITIPVPSALARASIRILPTGQSEPANPVPMKLERVL